MNNDMIVRDVPIQARKKKGKEKTGKRATIPSNVVEYLGWKVGDVIDWETFIHNGKHSARIRKLR